LHFPLHVLVHVRIGLLSLIVATWGSEAFVNRLLGLGRGFVADCLEGLAVELPEDALFL